MLVRARAEIDKYIAKIRIDEITDPTIKHYTASGMMPPPVRGDRKL